MMLEKLKNKLPGEKKSEKYSKPMPGVEIEIGEPEDEEAEGAEMASAEEEEVSVGKLAQFSDEELKAELEKRGMSVSEAAGEGPSAESEASAEAEPIAPRKKSPIA